jgi:hypothetical protein
LGDVDCWTVVRIEIEKRVEMSAERSFGVDCCEKSRSICGVEDAEGAGDVVVSGITEELN